MDISNLITSLVSASVLYFRTSYITHAADKLTFCPCWDQRYIEKTDQFQYLHSCTTHVVLLLSSVFFSLPPSSLGGKYIIQILVQCPSDLCLATLVDNSVSTVPVYYCLWVGF